jgi:SEC-C motif
MLKRLFGSLQRLLSGRQVRQPGRNDPCHCGSGRKYKRCCLDSDAKAVRSVRDQTASAKAGYVGGRATVANRALENANRYRRPKS